MDSDPENLDKIQMRSPPTAVPNSGVGRQNAGVVAMQGTVNLAQLQVDHTEHPPLFAAHSPWCSVSRGLSRSLFAVGRPSLICLWSVTFVRPTQAVQIFGNISTALGTLAIRWHPLKISRRSSQGNPSARGVNTRGVTKYSDFGPIDGYISEMVQDRR